MPILQVSRRELLDALKLLARHGRKGGGNVVVGYSDGCLELHYGGVTARASATGDWPGGMRIEPKYVIGIRSLLPREDPLVLRVDGNPFRVGGATYPCGWDDEQVELIPAAINTSRLDLLTLRYEYSDEQIAASGLAGPVADAEEWRDKLVERAAQVLEPLGVKHSDVERMVDTVLRRRKPMGLTQTAAQQTLPLSGEGGQLRLQP